MLDAFRPTFPRDKTAFDRAGESQRTDGRDPAAL